MLLRKIIFFSLLTCFSLTVLGYGTYKALPIFLGPEISINTPQNGEIVEGTSISVRGSVSRVKALYINSIPTSFTEEGNFESRLAIYPGSNILIIEAIDGFGRKKMITRSVGTKN